MITDLQRAHQSHDIRVRELLTANNREVKRRRALRSALEGLAVNAGPGVAQRFARAACDVDDEAAKN